MTTKIQSLVKQLWLTVIASGAISIIFGFIAMIWPSATLSAFIYLFSAILMIVSIISLGRSITNIGVSPLWWLSTLFAICGISISLYIMINPDIAKSFIAVLLAIYVFSQSLLDLIVASYSDDSKTKTPVVVVGIIGVIFGFVILFQPTLATSTLVWVIGLYIFLHGISAEYYAIRTSNQINKIKNAMNGSSYQSADNIAEAEIIDKTAKKSKRKTKKSTDE